VVNRRRAAAQRGLSLIELAFAVAIGAIILAALNSLVKLGTDAQAVGRSANELVYQGRFALERMVDKARTLAPKALSTPAANTTGDWFAPAGCVGAACVMYCLNAGGQLIETTTADTGCAGTKVIAGNVTAFSAQVPAAMGPVDRFGAVIGLTLTDGATNNKTNLSASVRLGGGTQ
jgi:prepilin-type N-terminal cleavage/methylation domain-containing protein